MNKLTFILLLLPIFCCSQAFVGFRYTGGLSYAEDHEYFSTIAGYDLPAQPFTVSLSGEYLYDDDATFLKKQRNFYILRIGAAYPISESFNLTAHAGYFNGFKTNMDSNFVYGFGVEHYSDDLLKVGLVWEKIHGNPYAAVVVKIMINK